MLFVGRLTTHAICSIAPVLFAASYQVPDALTLLVLIQSLRFELGCRHRQALLDKDSGNRVQSPQLSTVQSSTTRKLAGKQPATKGMTNKLAAAGPYRWKLHGMLGRHCRNC